MEWEIVTEPGLIIEADWQFLSWAHRDKADFEQGTDASGRKGGWIPIATTAKFRVIIRHPVSESEVVAGFWRRPKRCKASAAAVTTERNDLIFFLRQTPRDVVLAVWPGEE